MPTSPSEPSADTEPREPETAGATVLRFVPRPPREPWPDRPAPTRQPEPLRSPADGDDDPGPSAA